MSFTEVVVGGTLRPDGTLELDQNPNLSPGRVRVVLRQQSVSELPPLLPDEWRRRVLETAGKWRGKFERPEQGEYEQREPLAGVTGSIPTRSSSTCDTARPRT